MSLAALRSPLGGFTDEQVNKDLFLLKIIDAA